MTGIVKNPADKTTVYAELNQSGGCLPTRLAMRTTERIKPLHRISQTTIAEMNHAATMDQ